ncbi:polysaccharide biosynthesis protein [Polaribacter pacificus]|uniref:Polysaccharide biosynthesis protein n=1 Tax=Polaribacter pacificus TaxID=1775173 RepID=A0A917HX42_9FLAO|nr:oligosaccharide flippase family protein [Polaribacter pacificus]GGG93270.1 polysaccharide biosynthesis protein [Polaribacter pacificus]
MVNGLKRFFKDTIIYGIAAVLPRAINIFLVRLHTSTLEANTYAINTDYYVYAAYFNALLTFGMETAFFRFFSKEKEKGKTISTAFISLTVTSLIFLILMLLYSNELSAFFDFQNPLFFKLLVWTITLDTLVVIPYAYLRVANKPMHFTIYKILNILIFAVLNVFFLWFVPHAIKNGIYLPNFIIEYYNSYPKVMHIFVAGTIASATTFILLFPIVFKFKIDFDFQLLKKMLRYSIPIMVGSLAFVTNENLDKLLLGQLIGKEQMGIYAACYKLGVFMTLYIMAFRLGAEPFFFNHAASKNAKENYAKILTWFTLFGALFMLIVVLFIDVFAKILLGKPEYFQALQIVPIILLANLFLGIYNNLSVWYKLTDKTQYGMYFSILGALITIVFNVVMIPEIGFIASAWATLLTYGFMVTCSYYIGKKYYKVPYELKKIGFYLVISVAFCALSFLEFRGNYWFSISAIFGFFVLIYLLEKATIKQFLKR